jgi:hypothetical protein
MLHVPSVFILEPVNEPLLCQEVFVTGSYKLYNEDLAIVRMQPPVNKEDFGELKAALRTFFHEVHQVRTTDIQPCALGDAYVRFSNALDRERFLGPIFHFGDYGMTIIKHDEAENARSFDLDREAWVLLVGFPEDLKDSVGIAKAVSGFGILFQWHDLITLQESLLKSI